jgi:hypothetical protein
MTSHDFLNSLGNFGEQMNAFSLKNMQIVLR